MKSQEAVIRIVGKLDMLYGDVFDQARVRQAVEEVLYNYTIEDKETSLAVIDNIQDMALLYLATKKTEGLANDTIKSYGRGIGRFARFIKKNVEDITTMDIRMYLANRSKEDIKNTTLANDTDILKGFFNWLADEDYIQKIPTKQIKTIKVEKRLREALTKEELETLRLGAKTLREKALLETMYATGARLEEVERMKKSDIDWQRLKMNVIGKGNKERTVFINATCLVHLRKYLMSRLDDDSALFVTQRNPIKFLGRRAIQREIDKIMEQSDLKKNIFPHILRHTAAKHWLNNGMNITVVQELLGHEEIGTTQIYAQTSRTEIEHEYRKYS